jgi:hypothetical protein
MKNICSRIEATVVANGSLEEKNIKGGTALLNRMYIRTQEMLKICCIHKEKF